jgi:hypothetical protein
MGNAEIERLVEAQASGTLIAPANVTVESTIPHPAELDVRRSKTSLAGGPLLCEPLESGGIDSLPLEADRSPADPELLTAVADDLETQAQNVAGATDNDLGLVMRHDA